MVRVSSIVLHESQSGGTWTIPFSDGKGLRRGPVFVVLGDGDCVLGVETVETLTTLGAISSLCKTKNQYTAALAILPGLVNVAESDNTDGDFLRICASKTEAEHQWWNELLLWDQHGNWLG